MQAAFGNPQIAMKTIDHVGEGAVVIQLVAIDQSLKHQLPKIVTNRNAMVAQRIRDTHANVVRAQGFIQ